MWAPVATTSDCHGRRSRCERPSPRRTSGRAGGAVGGRRLCERRASEAPAGGDQRGTWSRGFTVTQVQRAAAVSGGVDQGGRWARASAPALRAEAKGATTRQLSEQPRRVCIVPSLPCLCFCLVAVLILRSSDGIATLERKSRSFGARIDSWRVDT